MYRQKQYSDSMITKYEELNKWRQKLIDDLTKQLDEANA